MTDNTADLDAEFEAMRAVYVAMKDLSSDAQQRVIDYVSRRLQLVVDDHGERAGSTFSPRELAQEYREQSRPEISQQPANDEELEGVSPVAQKWVRRNGLSPDQLSKLFSLGVDEIELVAKSVPGTSKRERMHNVILLAGAASYLGTGAAKVVYERLKEALGHYNAHDVNNFATYMKAFAPEITGSKESGYTLTARGLAAAAELIKANTASR